MADRQSNSALADYWSAMQRQQKEDLALRVKSTAGYLRQVFLYGRPAGPKMALRLGNETGLGAALFRPDLYGAVAAPNSGMV